jgi:hypothetical protein
MHIGEYQRCLILAMHDIGTIAQSGRQYLLAAGGQHMIYFVSSQR